MRYCPVVLHRLRNDQIYPHLWSKRAELAPKTEEQAEITFLDLDALKKQIIENGHELESLLYGAADEPIYSGWTWNRLCASLEKSGFSSPQLVGHDGFLARVIVRKAPWNGREKIRAKNWRRGQ